MPDRIAELLEHHPRLARCAPEIRQAAELLRLTYSRGHKVLLCGNGGSAADADHWAGELLKGFESPRPLTQAQRQGLPEHLASALQGALPTIPLTGFAAFRTAFGNDVDARWEFAQLVWSLGKCEDVLVGLSTSGNAANVCAAMEVARAKGLHRLALTGSDGGKLRELADICVCVPETRTLRVQELHLPVYHCLSLMLEDAFFA